MSARRRSRATAARACATALVGAIQIVAPVYAAGVEGRSAPRHVASAPTAHAADEDSGVRRPTATGPRAKGTGFDITRQVIAGGGGSSSGGAFAISGTIGQPDADPLQPSTGGAFAITGGFWPALLPATPPSDPAFADGFEPQPP